MTWFSGRLNYYIIFISEPAPVNDMPGILRIMLNFSYTVLNSYLTDTISVKIKNFYWCLPSLIRKLETKFVSFQHIVHVLIVIPECTVCFFY